MSENAWKIKFIVLTIKIAKVAERTMKIVKVAKITILLVTIDNIVYMKNYFATTFQIAMIRVTSA